MRSTRNREKKEKMNELSPQTQKICEYIGTGLAIAVVIAFIIFGIICIIWCNKTDELKKQYIKTLNEHDKSVIMDYKNTYYSFKRRKEHK